MLQTPFYDPEKSYEENYEKGPFGAFAKGPPFKRKGKPQRTFLGQKVYLPFGIPAGPLLNSKFVKGAFESGFDIAVYKTVRSNSYPSHPWPNVLGVDIDGDLTPEKMKQPLLGEPFYHEPLSITNSFGVPSKKPEVWQEDVRTAISYAGGGQVLVLSFMGTVREHQREAEFVEDFGLAARLSAQTGAKILEVNLSCPNIGNEGLVCYNLDVTKKVLAEIRRNIGSTPLIVKVGYFKSDDELEKLAAIVNEYADSLSAINTLPASIVNKEGKPALPGKQRAVAGVCGAAIAWAGLEMVRRLVAIRGKRRFKFSIEGVGGVTTRQDYFKYKEAGADSVMSATGAMWNPGLAKEIGERV